MIRETPQEFLDILKSYVPDANKPAGVARQEFSEFFAEFQSDERPAVEPVAIRHDLRGVWCSVPGAVPDLFGRLPACAGASLPGRGRRCAGCLSLPCPPWLPAAPDYSCRTVFGG